MPDEIAVSLAQAKRAFLVAPAGCGKTELIAKALASGDEGRQLVLTHTHAGVHSLRERIRSLSIPSKRFHLDTIAGWALKYASAYPTLSGLDERTPVKDEWKAVYGAALALVRRPITRDILLASYSGIFVDEYQDCVSSQHELILALANILPCRILGDPLQGIFDFGTEPLVDWRKDIAPNFDRLPDLSTPWRWKTGNSRLGEWLTQVRHALKPGDSIELSDAPVIWMASTPANEAKVCLQRARHNKESIVAIKKWAQGCHKVASTLNGVYTSMEEMECVDLMTWSKKIEHSKGTDRAAAVIDFATRCMTKVSTELRHFHQTFAAGRIPSLTRNKKNQEVLSALLDVATVDDLHLVTDALTAIEGIDGRVLYRRELWTEMKRSLAAYFVGEFTSLDEAAWYIRDRGRHMGRRVDLRTVSRTLLIKGLQFDHAIILDADQFDIKNLYVAMTRGVKSLTILSERPVLGPFRS